MTEPIEDTPASPDAPNASRDVTALLKVCLARSTDLAHLAERERTSQKEDILSLSGFQKNHADDRCLTLVAKTKLGSNSPRDYLGYVTLRSRVKDNLLVAWNVFLDRENPEGWEKYKAVGKLLFEKAIRLHDSFAEHRRRVTTILVRECDLKSQLLLKHAGFKCERIIPKWFDCPPDAAYVFKFRK